MNAHQTIVVECDRLGNSPVARILKIPYQTLVSYKEGRCREGTRLLVEQRLATKLTELKAAVPSMRGYNRAVYPDTRRYRALSVSR
jgi:hypothetical protein